MAVISYTTLSNCSIPALERYQRNLERRKQELKQEGKAERRRSPSRKRELDRIIKREKEIEASLNRVKATLSKHEKHARQLEVDRQEALDSFGQSGLKDRHIRALDVAERIKHTIQRVLARDNLPYETRQIGAVRRLVRNTSNPEREVPILHALVSEPKVVGKGKNRKIKYEVKSRGNVNPNRQIRQMENKAMDFGIEIQKRPSGRPGEVEHVIVDTVTGRELRTNEANSTYSAMKAEELRRMRDKDAYVGGPGDQPIKLDGAPPKKPQVAPKGWKYPDGSRVRTERPGNRVDPLTSVETLDLHGLIDNYLRIGKGWWDKAQKKLDEVINELGLPEIDLFGKAQRVYQQMDLANRQFYTLVEKPTRDAMKRYKIKRDRATMNRIDQAMIWRDAQAEHMFQNLVKNQKMTKEQAREVMLRREAELNQSMRENKSLRLTENEYKFIRDLDKVYDDLAEFFGVPSAERRVGFHTRLRNFTERFYENFNREPTLQQILEMDPSIENFWGMQLRLNELSEGGIDTHIRRISNFDHHLAEQLKHSGNAVDKLFAYGRIGVHRKVAGEAIRDLQRTFTLQKGEAGELARVFIGDVPIGQAFANRLQREITSMMRMPQYKQALAQARRRQWLLNRMKELNTLMGELKKVPALTRLNKPLYEVYKKLGIASTEESVAGFFELFSQMHRGQTFGLNPMASVRDMTSTAMLIGTRFRAKDFGEAFDKTFIQIARNPKAWLAEMKRQREAGWLDDLFTTQATPQLEALFEGKILSLVDQLQVGYRATDMMTRALVNRATENAIRRAYPKYAASAKTRGDYIKFLQETGLDLVPGSMSKSLRAEVNTALDSGNLNSLIRVAQRAHEAETAFHYARYNAPPIMDYAPGRAFLQYGSWPLNMMSTMYHTTTGPWKAYGGKHAALRTAQVGAKYAALAEGVYALGAFMGVDTSDWIPFLHNTIPTGGPPVTIAEYARGALAGDPVLVGMWESNPGLMMAQMGRRIMPIGVVPNSVRRAFSQMYEIPDDDLRKAFGVPEMQDSVWRRTLVGSMFTPAQRPLYPNWRQGGLPALAMQKTFGSAQDVIAEYLGDGGRTFPGGSEEMMRRFDAGLE